MYGAADVLVAEVQLQRLYPGGPARGRFIARHGPDNEIIGGFTLTAANSEGIPAMMAEGAQRIDQLFGQAMASGRLSRDPSLDLPPPPTLPPLPVQVKPVAAPTETVNSFQVQVTGKNVNFYNFAMAHLRTLPGVESATPQQINPGGTSYILVRFKGTAPQLAVALGGRGWTAQANGTVVTIHSETDKPPALPQPAAPAPSPATPPPAQPTTPPATQPPKAEQ
jgi:hypothetical protein